MRRRVLRRASFGDFPSEEQKRQGQSGERHVGHQAGRVEEEGGMKRTESREGEGCDARKFQRKTTEEISEQNGSERKKIIERESERKIGGKIWIGAPHPGKEPGVKDGIFGGGGGAGQTGENVAAAFGEGFGGAEVQSVVLLQAK
jgi:hypothetical protein